MARRNGDAAEESVMFESVGIGPSGGEPVDFVPVDVESAPLGGGGRRRARFVAVGFGLVILLSAIVWATTRSSTPDPIANPTQRLPTDASEAFVWKPPDTGEDEIWIGGSAANPLMLTLGRESGTLYSLDESGGERWHADVGTAATGEALSIGDAMIAIRAGDRGSYGPPGNNPGGSETVAVTAFDADTGERRWHASAPGNYWQVIDGHVVIFDFPDEVLDDVDGKPTASVGTTAASIDLETGEKAERRYDQVLVDGPERGVLVELDGMIFNVDGALEPTTAPVSAHGAGATDGDTVLTFDGETIAVYDSDGATLRSSGDLPDGMQGSTMPNITAAGADVWLYTTDASTPDCGVFRFGDGDTAPVELWHQQECYVNYPFRIGDDSDDRDAAALPYALLFKADSSNVLGLTRLIDVTTGTAITEGKRISLATNGILLDDGKRLTGQAVGPDAPPDPFFELSVDITKYWQLLDGAVAVAQFNDDGVVTSVTVYS